MPSTHNTASDVPDMNLYKLNRVHRTLDRLKDKTEWEAEDTKSFDCMHYLGDAAIENAAKQLDLQDGDRLLDIGSGFGGTGRYLYQRFHVTTAGIELQEEIHNIAQTINDKSGAGANATSINGNFLELDSGKVGAPFDHIVSFLCILHIPDREALFKKANGVLKPGGKMYIEDFFARTPLDAKTLKVLRSSVSCPDLPDKEHYIAELEKAGFEVTSWVDMSTIWTDFVHERAGAYKEDPSVDADLTAFYDAVDEVFTGGQVGGTRITCQRK
ncbi:methyltransferase domain-containing protein [Colletotrichum orchidophilum]|uniref:Methyltransferase domain-containing protein n=1 Tax=Colletotrichum orchidophilum TaxID=1209926 RepID=A0A1G4BE07_9PEZI|nr:methyltransferase domain-containing protein [Colletotrichum orchidophilum]OHE99654.1 methyltransferase domain-containing protein [Colletotrichum orchidophilum]